MLLIAREGIRERGEERGRGEGAKKVSRTSHCRYAALSLVRVPEASRYMRKALRRRTRTRTTMRRDEYGRSVGQGKLTFSIKVDRSQSKRNGSKNEIDDGRMCSNQFGRFLADQKSTFIISYILNFPQT